jgi:hypothetical protein
MVNLGFTQCHLAFGDLWNPTHKNGGDLRMVYGIRFTTLMTSTDFVVHPRFSWEQFKSRSSRDGSTGEGNIYFAVDGSTPETWLLCQKLQFYIYIYLYMQVIIYKYIYIHKYFLSKYLHIVGTNSLIYLYLSISTSQCICQSKQMKWSHIT